MFPTASFFFALSFLGILLFFLINPLMLALTSIVAGRKQPARSTWKGTVSFVTVVRNSEKIIAAKIRNLLSLDIPSDLVQIVMFSDGSSDGTVEKIRSFDSTRIELVESEGHKGKNCGLNNSLKHCSGEIVVFSDADSLFEKDAVTHLLRHFSDPDVGGVSGKRIIEEQGSKLAGAQSGYIGFDSTLKVLESRVGSITANDGKIYAIRRELFRAIPPGVTDDLYTCLSVIRQGFLFLFEPLAKTYIKMPSRSPLHEIRRRPRIVNRDLRSVFANRELLNPLRYGFFSLQLIVNKVGRRLLPVFLVLLFLSSMYLAGGVVWIRVFLVLQGLFYLCGLLYAVPLQFISPVPLLTRVCAMVFYFCIGNIGTFLGLLSLLRGERFVKWNPRKTSEAPG